MINSHNIFFKQKLLLTIHSNRTKSSDFVDLNTFPRLTPNFKGLSNFETITNTVTKFKKTRNLYSNRQIFAKVTFLKELFETINYIIFNH